MDTTDAYIEGLVERIRDYFRENGDENTKAVIGISGGKDSSVVAALCVEALGVERVLGVIMPNGYQSDIEDSYALIDWLKIPSIRCNIGTLYDTLDNQLYMNFPIADIERSVHSTNTPARLRMTYLYAVSAIVGGRVACTANLSEKFIGYESKWGDNVGDFSPIGNLTATEVIAVGEYLGLPDHLIHKVPHDGMCGMTDEENIGFTYKQLDAYIRKVHPLDYVDTRDYEALDLTEEVVEKIQTMNRLSQHKRLPIPTF